MVQVREESPNHQGRSGYRFQPPSGRSESGGIVKFLMDGGIDSILWLLRGMTIVCGLMFIFPLGLNKYSAYQKTLLSAATTNALRLHQRVGRVRFDMVFLQTIFAEDSFHYLLYSMTMLSVNPMTLGIATVMLYALLHWCNFFTQMMKSNNFGHTAFYQHVDGFVKNRTQSILHLAACSEIFLFPVIVGFAFTGKTNIITPFIYYRFLWVRYGSRRNPRTRMVFHDMRIFVENLARHRSCPSIISNFIYQLIGMISRLAPVTVQS